MREIPSEMSFDYSLPVLFGLLVSLASCLLSLRLFCRDRVALRSTHIERLVWSTGHEGEMESSLESSWWITSRSERISNVDSMKQNHKRYRETQNRQTVSKARLEITCPACVLPLHWLPKTISLKILNEKKTKKIWWLGDSSLTFWVCSDKRLCSLETEAARIIRNTESNAFCKVNEKRVSVSDTRSQVFLIEIQQEIYDRLTFRDWKEQSSSSLF